MAFDVWILLKQVKTTELMIIKTFNQKYSSRQLSDENGKYIGLEMIDFWKGHPLNFTRFLKN